MRTRALRLLASLPLVACGGKDIDIGDDVRPANPTCVAPDRPSTGGDVALERVFSNVSFDQAVALVQAPGDASRWFVVEQGGTIQAFDNTADVADTVEFLDITRRVDSASSETGLLGMAFHPDFATNGEVFVSYTAPSPLTSTVSRFTSADGGRTLDPDSEQILLEVTQPFTNHNGGSIAFGPDGYLYLGFGDGGSQGDPSGNGQDTNVLLAKILRIDVDGGDPYAIPADNPFAAGGGRAEVYAWGFRNPWRFSFDAAGNLWVGDVGQNEVEEVDRVERGGNYGWNIKEGTHCYAEDPCDLGGLIDPVVEYSHRLGQSITGGFVYRGGAMPGLQSAYFYADYVTGTLWTLQWDPVTGEPDAEVVVEAGFYISSFGEDADGELYVLDYGRGRIHRIVPDGAPEPAPFPATLAETGCFDAAGTPVDALLPYDVTSPLWSDGAEKARWFAIPDGTTIAVEDDGDLTFPIGSVLAKQFSLGGEKVETRLFVRHEDGEWAGYTYAWDGGTAALLTAGETRAVGADTWTYPSRAECLQCHTGAAGRSLGLELSQLTGDGGTQLARWEAMELFEDPLPTGIAPLVDPADTAATDEARARAYLHANCASCHRPEGTGQGPADLRATVPLGDMALCGQAPQEGSLGVDGAVLLDPGHPERSLVSLRMHTLDADRMPDVGSQVVDPVGVSVVDAWIRGLVVCP
jgi:uncharacterized repeat protein (TIGR03806 family)